MGPKITRILTLSSSQTSTRPERQGPAAILRIPHSSPCPNCTASASDWLRRLSRDAYVNYFQCKTCRHVWLVPKPGVPGEPCDVTPRGRRKGH